MLNPFVRNRNLADCLGYTDGMANGTVKCRPSRKRIIKTRLSKISDLLVLNTPRYSDASVNLIMHIGYSEQEGNKGNKPLRKT